MARWLGVDFSGSAAEWCRRRSSNVWIADLRGRASRPRVAWLAPAQSLAGEGSAWERLVVLLARGDYAACGVDAPFSLPAALLGARSHREIVALAAELPRGERPFPTGEALVRAAAGRPPPLAPPKPLRECEVLWSRRGVNVRSTAWTGARPGAAFTAACLALLARAGRPVWPFDGAPPGCLVESFPAAQLRQWGLPHRRYAGTGGAAVRRTIVDALGSRADLARFRAEALASADALDAVVAAFGALAAAEGRLADAAEPRVAPEGWIAVHR